ncbi:probable multidrug resistance-associated protein lethal(2)03659 [Bacillus rossius redtenbacheri]|uniref:probable multidrug resistance-associated protein lethal(2)03659 n=1 Tax=Bacillus rossius redtenbacheri TaxID=93214 RepID=UPI002FDCCF61
MMITNYILIVPMVFVAAAIYKMRNIFTRTIQAMRRLEGTTCGPVLTHLSSTLEGLATIRAGGSQEVMSMDYYTYQDIHTSAFYLLCTTVTASAFWFDIVVNIFVGCVCYSFLILENAAGAAAADVGLAVQQSLLLVGTLHYCVRCAAESAAHLGSVRRALDYASLPPEEGLQPGTGNEPPPTWPSKGAIQFDHLTLRYSSDSPPALRDVTVNIEPGQKVGVVGRPGAGKSALLAALLRLAPTDGAARLDGTDTRTVSVRRLRRRVSVLEARPAVFPASLRDNLDPERGRRDSELWAALREVGMKDAERTLLIPVGSGGGHHSLEQKQLICLARAVLAGNKILVMDEATANADLQTASLIHETVRKKFKDCTVLTMTQDPRIVIGCDRIMVMSAGTMVEFGHPHLLLLNPEGHFYKLVQECGTSVAKELYREAQESYRRNEPEAETPEIEDD